MKKVIILSMCLILSLSLFGCGIKNKIKNSLTNEETNNEQIIENNVSNYYDYDINFDMKVNEVAKITDNSTLEYLGEKSVYGNNEDCYKIELKDLKINFILPNNIINTKYELVNSINDISLTNNKDFDKTFIMNNSNMFTLIKPSGYYIIASEVNTDDNFNKTLENSYSTGAFVYLFNGSFISIVEGSETFINEQNGIYYALCDVNIMPYINDPTLSYSGRAIFYSDKNVVKFLIVGTSNFSYDYNSSYSICNYIVSSSNVTFSY